MSLSSRTATLIGAAAILNWGLLAPLTRMAGKAVPPFQLLAMTFAIGFLVTASGWVRRPASLAACRQLPARVWLLGIGGLFGYHFCYFLAMRQAPAVEVSLLAYLWPLLIVLLSSCLPGHALRGAHVAGALSALAGCWLLLRGGQGGFDARYLSGYVLAVACALIWSVYSVLSRLTAAAPSEATGGFCAVTALLGLFCHLLWEKTVWPDGAGQWLGVLALGLGPVGVAFYCWDVGVKRGNLPLLGVLAYAAPLISTLSLCLMGETAASLSLLLACLLIVGGALLTGLARNPARTA